MTIPVNVSFNANKTKNENFRNSAEKTSLHLSSGYVQCRFDNTNQLGFIQRQQNETYRFTNFFKTSCRNCLSGHTNCRFHNTTQFCSSQRQQNKTCKFSKFFIQVSLQCFPDTSNANLTTLVQIVSLNAIKTKHESLGYISKKLPSSVLFHQKLAKWNN